MAKKILVLLGNPDKESYSGAIADHYQAGAQDAGHEVVRVNIGDLHFDPILHQGHKVMQELEPDLVELQEQIRWAEHIVFVYPNWWCAMPAILKGLFDRIWLPGFAYNVDEGTGVVTQLLKGKSARVIIASGNYGAFQTWWKYGDYTNEIQHGILGYAGISSAISALGPVDKVNDQKREAWLRQMDKLGRAAR